MRFNIARSTTCMKDHSIFKISSWFFLVLLIHCAFDSTPLIFSQERIELLDIPYPTPVNGDSTMTKMDVYYVPDEKPKKLMVFIHGGSWIGGDKSNLRTKADAMIQWFLDRDYVVAAPNFRLASKPSEPREITYREQATDIVYALAWLKENSNQYGVREPGMLLIGYSSGTHLAPLITSDSSYLQMVGLSFADIRGAVSLDVHAYDIPFALQLMQGSVVEHNIPLIKYLFGNTVTEQIQASPISYISNTPLPPRIIISVGAQSSIPGSRGYITSQASKHYVQELLTSGHQATWKQFDTETHGTLVLDFGTEGDGPTQEVEKFIQSIEAPVEN